MTLNFQMQAIFTALACGSLWVLILPISKRDLYDRWVFLGASVVLVGFVIFRPLGTGVDDVSYAVGYFYASSLFDTVCPSLECGHWIQGKRDQGWYSIVGLLKSFNPHPQVMLWLAGLALVVKLFVMGRLSRNRSLALLFYTGCFYIIHDITALRVSLAVSVYLIGFFLLVKNKRTIGIALLAINGFFHQQAFVAPILLLGRWLSFNKNQIQFALLLPMVLLLLGVYPGDALLSWIMTSEQGSHIATFIFHGYERNKLAGAYDQTRTWPVVVPPTICLAAWLMVDLYDSNKILYKYSAMSLIVATLFLWGYAVIPEVQLRFWHFFLLPIVFVFGNAHLNFPKFFVVFALSAIYLIKYTVVHDLLRDQFRIYLHKPEGGEITLSRDTPSIPCGVGCGYRVEQGISVQIQAIPEEGNQFERWYGACEGTDPTCTISIIEDTSVGAKFGKSAPSP